MKKMILGAILSCFIMNVDLSAQCVFQSTTAATLPHLKYYGGPVITNVKVVDVLWGPNVNVEVKENMPLFFNALITSVWMDGFSEYNTVAKAYPTTNQAIGRGTFIGQFMISPIHTSSSITEADIQAELAAQLDSGRLPAPQYDDLGYLETIYVIEFPPNITITANDGSVSCVDFCAFHSDMMYNGKWIMYAIHPDFSAGCASGCGSGTLLQNQQSVHSHELAEAITDPEVGTNTLSWYDVNNGENGDICNGLSTEIVIDGVAYTVQKTWSNVKNQCLGVMPSLLSPTNFILRILTNSKEVTHELSFDPSPSQYLNGYRIIEGGSLLATIPASGPFIFNAKNRDPSKKYVYRLIAFNNSGIQSTFQVVTAP